MGFIPTFNLKAYSWKAAQASKSLAVTWRRYPVRYHLHDCKQCSKALKNKEGWLQQLIPRYLQQIASQADEALKIKDG